MIQLLFYGSIFVISLLFAATYIFMWHKHFDVNFTLIFTLVPVACLGYLMTAAATSLDGAVRATQIVYIGGCFLQLFILQHHESVRHLDKKMDQIGFVCRMRPAVSIRAHHGRDQSVL